MILLEVKDMQWQLCNLTWPYIFLVHKKRSFVIQNTLVFDYHSWQEFALHFISIYTNLFIFIHVQMLTISWKCNRIINLQNSTAANRATCIYTFYRSGLRIFASKAWCNAHWSQCNDQKRIPGMYNYRSTNYTEEGKGYLPFQHQKNTGWERFPDM